LPHVSFSITQPFPTSTAHRSSMAHSPPLSGSKPSDAEASPAIEPPFTVPAPRGQPSKASLAAVPR